MNKLFQHVRKINWNYIIGEILLIVCGILIALYINNLNEERKLKAFETKILTEIEESLTRDFQFHIESRISRGNQLVESAQNVLAFLDGKIDHNDALEKHFWRINWIIIFEPQTIPFERLKAKGIEVLSNEDAKLKLLELYDFTYPNIIFFTTEYNRWCENYIEPYSLENFKIKDLDRGKAYEPINIQNLKNSIIYRNLVIEKITRTQSLMRRMKATQSKIENLLHVLKQK